MDHSPFCPKCGSLRIDRLGQSLSPPAIVLRCLDCGHSTAIAPQDRSPTITADNVQRVVESVIDHFGLPFTVSAVTAVGSDWHIVMWADASRTVRLQIKSGTFSEMRAAVRAILVR